MIKKIRPNWWWLLGVIVLVTLAFSWIFSYQTDLNYLQDLFENSQWRVASSTRIISDSQLYEWAGYQLWQGEPIYNINPEVPPLVKYLYGLAIITTGNPYLLSFVFYLLAILFFYLMARQILKDQQQVWWATIIFALMPSVYRQVTHAMLDLPQLLWLLIHSWTMLVLISSKFDQLQNWKKYGLLLTAGLSLGAFAATKIALYLPVIMLIDVWVLWQSKKWWQAMIIFPISGLFYLVTYTMFFIDGGSLWQWLGNQKWMFEFYRSSQVKAIPFLAVITIISGWYQGWWNEGWQRVEVWNLLWPLSVAASLWVAIKDRLKSQQLSYLYLLFIILLALNSVIPFWARYYLLMLPFGLVLVIKKWGNHKWLMLSLTLMLLGQLYLFVHPQPSNLIKFFNEKASYEYWSDVYQFLSADNKKQLSRTDFVEYMEQNQISGSEIKLSRNNHKYVYPWQNKVEARLGENSVQLVRARGDWVLDWAPHSN